MIQHRVHQQYCTRQGDLLGKEENPVLFYLLHRGSSTGWRATRYANRDALKLSLDSKDSKEARISARTTEELCGRRERWHAR